RVVGHNPDGALDLEEKRKRYENTRKALEEHYFDVYDREIRDIEGIDDARSDGIASNPGTEEGGDVVDCRGYGDGFAPDTKVAAHARASTRAETKDEMISINIRYQGVDTSCRVKKTCQLSDFFKSFALSKGKTVAQFEFTYMNQRISGRSSPHSLRYNERDALYHNGKGCIFATLKAGNVAGKSEETLTNPREDQIITIQVRDQTGGITFVRVKRRTKMDLLFNAYASQKEVHPGSLRFFFKGEVVSYFHTPLLLELSDQDQIDVVPEQNGCWQR
ncbi:hypothetical protein ACHAW6_001728, partial [Cyclotella cf. meneghiniana]